MYIISYFFMMIVILNYRIYANGRQQNQVMVIIYRKIGVIYG